ncbi:hypothetical protein GQ42DRAFT_165032 [Ramicandelaber brevisporus]|nr:hypothetical protein GQ42DRAFT_165032 [Ramicandelaber brevisporus]
MLNTITRSTVAALAVIAAVATTIGTTSAMPAAGSTKSARSSPPDNIFGDAQSKLNPSVTGIQLYSSHQPDYKLQKFAYPIKRHLTLNTTTWLEEFRYEKAAVAATFEDWALAAGPKNITPLAAPRVFDGFANGVQIKWNFDQEYQERQFYDGCSWVTVKGKIELGEVGWACPKGMMCTAFTGTLDYLTSCY